MSKRLLRVGCVTLYAHLLQRSLSAAQFGRVLHRQLRFHSFAGALAGRLQGLDGEGGVKPRLHVVVAGAALHRAQRRALRLQALGQGGHGSTGAPCCFGLDRRLHFLPADEPLGVLRASDAVGGVRVGEGHELVDELLTAYFLYYILLRKTKATVRVKLRNTYASQHNPLI